MLLSTLKEVNTIHRLNYEWLNIWVDSNRHDRLLRYELFAVIGAMAFLRRVDDLSLVTQVAAWLTQVSEAGGCFYHARAAMMHSAVAKA